MAFAPPITVQVVPYYTLQTSVVGSGTISVEPASDLYLSNTVVVLTATPAYGWLFDHWSGDVVGNTNPASLIMNGSQASGGIRTSARLHPANIGCWQRHDQVEPNRQLLSE